MIKNLIVLLKSMKASVKNINILCEISTPFTKTAKSLVSTMT